MAVRIVVEGLSHFFSSDEYPGMGLNQLNNIPIGQWYLTVREWRSLCWGMEEPLVGNGGPSGMG